MLKERKKDEIEKKGGMQSRVRATVVSSPVTTRFTWELTPSTAVSFLRFFPPSVPPSRPTSLTPSLSHFFSLVSRSPYPPSSSRPCISTHQQASPTASGRDTKTQMAKQTNPNDANKRISECAFLSPNCIPRLSFRKQGAHWGRSGAQPQSPSTLNITNPNASRK